MCIIILALKYITLLYLDIICFSFLFYPFKKLLKNIIQHYHTDKKKMPAFSPELSENWGSSQVAACSFSEAWIGGGDLHLSMLGGCTSKKHGTRERIHNWYSKMMREFVRENWSPLVLAKNPNLEKYHAGPGAPLMKRYILYLNIKRKSWFLLYFLLPVEEETLGY